MGRKLGSRNKPKNQELAPPPPEDGEDAGHVEAAPAAKGSVPGDNLPAPMTPDEVRALFLGDLKEWMEIEAEVAEAKSVYDSLKSRLQNKGKVIAKRDHYNLIEIKSAARQQTPEGEEAVRDLMLRHHKAAVYIGSSIGHQFSFDLGGDRTPIEDRAFDEGKMCHMRGEAARPPYDPSTAAFRQFMAGYHEAQAASVAAGIKPLDDDDRDLRPRHLRQPGASATDPMHRKDEPESVH